nr:SprB repeat-containing protein [Chitinophagales bacterium]
MIVFTRKRIFTLFFLGFQYFILPSSETCAQIPTGQDCLGAAPVCQPTYTTASSTPGTGNYPNEQGPGTCLDPGEYNSSWFTFNISIAGTFAFTITPTIPNTDYDWALYNLSNASCADILTNGSLMVSCNSSQFGYTGISSTGVGNWNGPGFTNAFNYLINVNVGETYVLNINNWSGTNGGYSLDFGTSVASIFDTIKPKLDTIQPVICNENVLTFSFSEKVLCSSVQDDDFTLTGPGGIYTLSNVTGSACSVGGNEESVFTCTITPSITIGGNYFLHLTNTASTVNDPCGNLADTISLPFYVSSVAAILDSVIQPTCGGNNGSIYLSASVGTPPYLFTLNGSPYQSTGVYTGLDSGTYSLIVIDSFACSDTIEVILLPATGAVSASISSFNNINCYNSCDGWINVNASGGIPPYTYSWSNGGSSATVSGLCVGNYMAIIADNYNCADTISLTLTEPPEVHFDVLALQNVICHGYEEGEIAMKVTGGTPPYTYIWTPYGGGDDTAIQLSAGIYTLMV